MRTTLLAALVLVSAVAHADNVPSFHDDVLPILTRYGCNSGGCHGKLAGQNGFKLSLRGFAPEDDFEAIAREGRGRRISPAAPMHSLLIAKATGRVPHGGGTRFATDSAAARLLADWISAGMPAPNPEDHRPVELRVSRAGGSAQPMRPGDSESLTVTAIYADGRQRDVTWLSRIESNDSTTVEATEDGTVTAIRPGETVVRASFRGLIEIAEFTIPYRTDAPAEPYAGRNNPIDDAVFDKLWKLGIEPAPPCDDATFLRRASLDAVGTLPTPAEVRKFLADQRPDKRERLVEELLDRPEFVDYWALWLADLLQNRKERDHDVRGTKGVRNFHAWIRRQVADERSWKEIATEVLTAKGTDREDPAVGYYIVTVGEKEAEQSEVGDSVAQAFLGTRIGCARCHNHPLEKYTQDDYYHFIGFFSRVALKRQKPEEGPTELIIGTKHLVNLHKQLEKQEEKLAELRTTLHSGTAEDATSSEIEKSEQRIEDIRRQIEQAQQADVLVRQPRTGVMLAPRPLDRSEHAVAAGSDPRDAFVDWLTDPANKHFSGAMINRLWKHFHGTGLVEPVDDLRATNPPSNQPLWDLLNREFVENDYDLKHIMRMIMNSRTYQLAADTSQANFRDRKFYSHFEARRLPAEVLLDAICSATGKPERFDGYPLGIRAIQVPDPFADSYFLTMFGRAPRTTACACERENEVTLPQLLHLQNSDELTAKLKSHDGRLRQLLAEHTDDRRLIEEIYLTTLSRFPSAAESESIASHFRNADRQEVAIDLFWALLNTSEFTFNH